MAIKALETKTMSIVPVKETDAQFKSLDKAQSVNMGLPDKFTIPEKPSYALMTFNNLKDEHGNARQGIGVEILDGDKSKVVTVSSLSRKFFDEAVTVGDTRGKSQKAVIDAFQEENTMQLSPSEQVNIIAGKTIEKAGTVNVWVADFADGEVKGYTETEKAIYTAK